MRAAPWIDDQIPILVCAANGRSIADIEFAADWQSHIVNADLLAGVVIVDVIGCRLLQAVCGGCRHAGLDDRRQIVFPCVITVVRFVAACLNKNA
jgi:hypothetical protein